MIGKTEKTSFKLNKKFGLICLAAAAAAGIAAGTWNVYAAETEDVQEEATADEAELEEIFETVDEDGITHNEQKVTDTDDDGGTVVSETVEVSGTADYNLETKLFSTQYGEDGDATSVVSNVANGMYTNDSVSLSIGNELSGKLYKDGVQLTDQDLTSITEPGGYTLMLTLAGGKDVGSFTFSIIGEYTTASSYVLPTGFSMIQAGRNGTIAEYSKGGVKFTDEGEYFVSYVCDATNEIYTLSTSVDHTAPTLALSAVNSEGVAHSAVSLEDLEDGATIMVTRDGKSITPGKTLQEPGRYRITVQDAAGNINNYAFTIYMYFTLSSFFVILLFSAAFIALIVYIIVSRKNLRTR